MPVTQGLFAEFGFADIDGGQSPMPERAFKRLFYREKTRSERSDSAFLLALLDLTAFSEVEVRRSIVEIYSEHLTVLVRTADACGWLKEFELFGCVFVDIDRHDIEHAMESIELRIRGCMKMWLASSVYQNLRLSIQVFPRNCRIQV